jgi:hypothetical protein
MPRKPSKPKLTFAERLNRYPTYDPEVEGYGNSRQWRGAFRQRMGLDEAREILQDKSPRSILGVALLATWDEIKSAYRNLAKLKHPDINKSATATQEFQEIQAAYSVLESEFGK